MSIMSEIAKEYARLQALWLSLAELQVEKFKLEKETDQHMLRLKNVAIKRIEEVESLLSDKIYTFSSDTDEGHKFGFSECYVNKIIEICFKEGVLYGKKEFEKQNQSKLELANEMYKLMENYYDVNY